MSLEPAPLLVVVVVGDRRVKGSFQGPTSILAAASLALRWPHEVLENEYVCQIISSSQKEPDLEAYEVAWSTTIDAIKAVDNLRRVHVVLQRPQLNRRDDDVSTLPGLLESAAEELATTEQLNRTMSTHVVQTRQLLQETKNTNMHLQTVGDALHAQSTAEELSRRNAREEESREEQFSEEGNRYSKWANLFAVLLLCLHAALFICAVQIPLACGASEWETLMQSFIAISATFGSITLIAHAEWFILKMRNCVRWCQKREAIPARGFYAWYPFVRAGLLLIDNIALSVVLVILATTSSADAGRLSDPVAVMSGDVCSASFKILPSNQCPGPYHLSLYPPMPNARVSGQHLWVDISPNSTVAFRCETIHGARCDQPCDNAAHRLTFDTCVNRSLRPVIVEDSPSESFSFNWVSLVPCVVVSSAVTAAVLFMLILYDLRKTHGEAPTGMAGNGEHLGRLSSLSGPIKLSAVRLTDTSHELPV